MQRAWVTVPLWIVVGTAGVLAFLGANAPSWDAAFRAPLAPILTALVPIACVPVAALSGARWARRLLRGFAGATLGALAGLATYTVGYVITARGAGTSTRPLVELPEEALYSATMLEVASVTIGAIVGLALTRYAWRLYGTVSYIALIAIVAGYLVHAVTVAIPALPRSALPLSLTIVAAEGTSLVMVVVHAFYALDVTARRRWRRHASRAPFSRFFVPKVSVHVATYNEPPEMVIETLESVRALDYPAERLHVLVLDDSTDPSCSEPLRAYCERRGLPYHHREDRRGFKAGALNEGLHLTPDDVDLVAVLDADFQVDPAFLRETVGHFLDPQLGFLQTPQDYRNANDSFLTRQYQFADAYFYRAVLPSRNEENAIIFCGTMGILRKQAIEDAGGWGEAYLCEDAELSVRILSAGYSSLYVNKTYGRGLIPPTFEAYQKQHHRWAYGGAQVLRGHFGRFLLGRLSARQKVDFLVGGLHWFEGIALVVMAMALFALGVADLLGLPLLTHHRWDIWLLALVPFLLTVDGVVRIHLAMRRATPLPITSTLGVMGMWMSVKFNTTWAAVLGLLGRPLAFARTPKAPSGRISRWRALQRALGVARVETAAALALAGVAGALAWRVHEHWLATSDVFVTRALLAVWLLYYALMFACAPIYAYKSWTTLAPGVATQGAPGDAGPDAVADGW